MELEATTLPNVPQPIAHANIIFTIRTTTTNNNHITTSVCPIKVKY